MIRRKVRKRRSERLAASRKRIQAARKRAEATGRAEQEAEDRLVELARDDDTDQLDLFGGAPPEGGQ